MSCRGVLFAFDSEACAKLRAIDGNEELLELVYEEFEEEYDDQWICQTDKAWDAIHRCLTGGLLNTDGEPYPLALCILGGKQLYEAKSALSQDYFFCFVEASQVRDVANALAAIGEKELQRRYWALDPDQYDGPIDENDWNYTLTYFREVKAFYTKAAESGRAVLFTVDQ